MTHPKTKGDRTTLAVMMVLHMAGFRISVPFGENTRYDIILDNEGRLSRVQCKTGRLRTVHVWFATCSAYGHHRDPKNARRDYVGEVDGFAVHCPDTSGVYLIPIEDLPVRVQAALRVDPARNSQRIGIRMAADYQVGKVAAEHLRADRPS